MPQNPFNHCNTCGKILGQNDFWRVMIYKPQPTYRESTQRLQDKPLWQYLICDNCFEDQKKSGFRQSKKVKVKTSKIPEGELNPQPEI